MTNEEIKLKIRVEFENGESLTKLAKKYKKKYNTLKSWKTREDWEQKKKKKRKVAPKDAPKKNAPALKIKDAPKDAIELQFVEEVVEKMLESDLSQREKDFCLYYAMSGNMIQSGLKSGYSKNYSTTGLYRLLDKDKIKNEIKKINEIRYKNILTNEKDVLMQYIRIAYANIGDYLVQDEEGAISLKDLDEMDARVIKEISVEKDYKNDDFHTQISQIQTIL